MKLKCNLCNEGPIVELPEPQYFDELILCPNCGKTLASVKKDSFENLVWKVWDKKTDEEWVDDYVEIIE